MWMYRKLLRPAVQVLLPTVQQLLRRHCRLHPPTLQVTLDPSVVSIPTRRLLTSRLRPSSHWSGKSAQLRPSSHQRERKSSFYYSRNGDLWNGMPIWPASSRNWKSRNCISTSSKARRCQCCTLHNYAVLLLPSTFIHPMHTNMSARCLTPACLIQEPLRNGTVVSTVPQDSLRQWFKKKWM